MGKWPISMQISLRLIHLSVTSVPVAGASWRVLRSPSISRRAASSSLRSVEAAATVSWRACCATLNPLGKQIFPTRAKSGHFASVQVTARATSGSSRIKRHLGDADGGMYRKQGAKYQAERKFFPAHSLRSGVMFWLFTPYVASRASGRSRLRLR